MIYLSRNEAEPVPETPLENKSELADAVECETDSSASESAAEGDVEEDVRVAEATPAVPDVEVPSRQAIGMVRAKFTLHLQRENFLSFEKGEMMDVLVRKPMAKWWYGRRQNGSEECGWIPSNYVEEVAMLEAKD